MAQKRRKDLMEKRRQQRITLLCIAGGIGAVLLSVLICLIVFDIRLPGDEEAAPEQTAIPYDASLPFSLSDLTGEQLQQLRTQGSLRVSDGPRGISVGDSLDLLLTRYPSSFTQKQADSDQTGEQSDEEIILYCADYFENQNGVMTALPPRGLLTTGGDTITVTLLAPASPYPEGTLDSYGSYEHVYCVFTVQIATMTVSAITLGISR